MRNKSDFSLKRRPMPNVKKIVKELILFLNDRGGFDAWWGDIEPEIQKQILNGMIEIINENLKT